MFSLGERLKEVRQNNNLSQAEFAKLLDVSLSTYKRHETNEKSPDADVLTKIINRFKIDGNWLLTGYMTELIELDVISNSIELRIRKKIEAEFNNFQHEIIFLYDSLENFEDNKELPLLLTHLEQAKIPLSNLIKHAITEKDRKSVLNFIDTLSDIEKLYILQNISLFRRMLWDSMAWSNRIFHKSPA